MYTVGRPLSRNVLFRFLLEVHFGFRKYNWAAQSLQYEPNSRWNMPNMLFKISCLSGRHTVYLTTYRTFSVLNPMVGAVLT